MIRGVEKKTIKKEGSINVFTGGRRTKPYCISEIWSGMTFGMEGDAQIAAGPPLAALL
jgi:hypothetical protein